MPAPARHFNGRVRCEWQDCLFLSCHARRNQMFLILRIL